MKKCVKREERERSEPLFDGPVEKEAFVQTVLHSVNVTRLECNEQDHERPKS